MKIRKCLHKVIVAPSSISQWLGVVLVEKRLITINYNLLCFDSSFPQTARATPVCLTSSHHINRIPVTAPILGQDFRVLFYGGVSPSKIGLIAPY
jgi:hypothetical protein